LKKYISSEAEHVIGRDNFSNMKNGHFHKDEHLNGCWSKISFYNFETMGLMYSSVMYIDRISHFEFELE
jgi:hypothetical protein